MRLYFTEFASSERFGFRPLQVAAVVGAIAIGSVLHILCGSSIVGIGGWCAAIAADQCCIVVVNRLFVLRDPGDQDLRRWAIAKASLAGLGAIAWSLGPMLLHVDGQLLTVIVPPWTIFTYCCGAVWAGAFYAPALLAMIVGSTVPAAAWLLTGQGAELATGVCLLLAIPYYLFIGHAASLRYRAAVIDKIDVALLLERQRLATARIEQLNAERTRFFSAASHDLRQPLHAIGLYVALLRDEPVRGQRDELIDNILQCARSLDSQFDAILGVSETEKLIGKAQPAATPLQEVFDRIGAQARPTAAAAGLKLRIVRTGAWATIAPDVLERVLGNLVSNAIRYTRTGGVLVGARRRSGAVVVCVVDTGIGIAPEHREAVFGDFYQVDNPERNSARGYGLGLGIVRRLCEGMNWPVEMLSTPGRGTSFAIAVPVAAPVARMLASSAADQPASLLRGRRALVVDDDERVRDAMRRMLERWGVDASFCATAEEALAVLATSAPDVKWHALIDYRLGGATDGLTLAQQMRRAYGDRALLALVTGEADETLEREAEALGVAILRKPVQPLRLRALLAR